MGSRASKCGLVSLRLPPVLATSQQAMEENFGICHCCHLGEVRTPGGDTSACSEPTGDRCGYITCRVCPPIRAHPARVSLLQGQCRWPRDRRVGWRAGWRASGSQVGSEDIPLAFMGKWLLHLQPKVILPITAERSSRSISVKDPPHSPLPFPLCCRCRTM